jgi:hypothetical protein
MKTTNILIFCRTFSSRDERTNHKAARRLGFRLGPSNGRTTQSSQGLLTGRELAVHWGISPSRVCQLAKGLKLGLPA